MWTVALSASIFLRALQLASATGCPELPTGSFLPAAEIRALTCVDPAVISGAPNSAGHVQLSDLTLVSSKAVECTTHNDALRAVIPAAAGASISLGPAVCQLVAVRLSKDDRTSPATVEMRLDFDNCTVGTRSGTVLLDVKKIADNFMAAHSLYPFLEEACVAATVTPAQSVEKSITQATEVMVGGSECVGDILMSLDTDKRACKLLCIAHIEKYNGVYDPQQCGGYAFDTTAGATGHVCKLYKGKPVTRVSIDVSPGWFCWNMTTEVTKVDVSTVAPPTAEELAAADANLPKLNIVLPDATSASILTFASKDNTCFQPFNVITLQDATFQTVSVKVKESEWASFLELIPKEETVERKLTSSSYSGVVSSVFTDRVAYGSAAAPPLQQVAAQPVAAAAVAAKEVQCTPVPAESDMPFTVILLNIFMGLSIFACGYAGHFVGLKSVGGAANLAKQGFYAAPAE